MALLTPDPFGGPPGAILRAANGTTPVHGAYGYRYAGAYRPIVSVPMPSISLAGIRHRLTHRRMVREELRDATARCGEHAHAFVLRKLNRGDITSRYRAVLMDVERALKPKSDRRP
jgi:hypothetical protein